MRASDFETAVRDLGFGKTLPTAVYVYAPTSETLTPALQAVIDRLRLRLKLDDSYNVLKFSKDFSVSFLRYPRFFENPHPELAESVRVNLATGTAKHIAYERHANPPILHRKERFLPAGHPSVPLFARLTSQEEQAQLFEKPSAIGFKANWEKLLIEKGLAYSGHELIRRQHDTPASPRSIERVHRHRTALTRTQLSKPLRQALESGVLCSTKTLFDYGCGLGTDANMLRTMGYTVGAWDPAYFPDDPKVHADVVNLGYVLNVIEDPAERVEVLVEAWSYTRDVLIVSTLIAGNEEYDSVRHLSDGILTKRNTFQKYFSPTEIRGLIESALEVEAYPLSVGIYVAFRDERNAQSFLSQRSHRVIDWAQLNHRLGLPAPRKRAEAVDLYQQHKELLDEFWNSSLDLGRLPHEGEFQRCAELRRALGSPAKAHRLLLERFGEETYFAACQSRKEDLLVYLATSQLRKRIPPKALGFRLQADLISHFGSYSKAQADGQALLLSLRNKEVLHAAAQTLSFGWWNSAEGHFRIHRSLIEDLPPSLRVFLECAARLYGSPRNADVIKLHLNSHKVTFLSYDDFDRKPFPILQSRTKIDLPRLSINVFESDNTGMAPILCFKERFLNTDYPGYKRMQEVSRRLSMLLNVQASNLGPNDENAPSQLKLAATMKQLGLKADLTKLRKRKSSPEG
jgi:DNA phosphorothioation-associated putative methyltransferase